MSFGYHNESKYQAERIRRRCDAIKCHLLQQEENAARRERRAEGGPADNNFGALSKRPLCKPQCKSAMYDYNESSRPVKPNLCHEDKTPAVSNRSLCKHQCKSAMYDYNESRNKAQEHLKRPVKPNLCPEDKTPDTLEDDYCEERKLLAELTRGGHGDVSDRQEEVPRRTKRALPGRVFFYTDEYY